MKCEHIEKSLVDGILSLKLNRTNKKNAINNEMYLVLSDALSKANSDHNIKVVTLLGQKGFFTSGNDIADFASFTAKKSPVIKFLENLSHLTKPLIIGVDGLAIGIGTTILLHADIAIASENSVFQTPFTDLALVPENASSFLAPFIMGYQKAYALLVVGEKFSSQEAQEAGLIYKICQENEVTKKVIHYANLLASKPQQALAKSKKLMKNHMQAQIQMALKDESLDFHSQLLSQEAQEIFLKFLNKKKN